MPFDIHSSRVRKPAPSPGPCERCEVRPATVQVLWRGPGGDARVPVGWFCVHCKDLAAFEYDEPGDG